MRQEINLFLLIPKRTGFYLTIKNTATFYTIFLIMLLFMYGNIILQKRKIEKEMVGLHEQVATLQNQTNILLAKYPVSDPIELDKIVKELESQYSTKTIAVDILLSYSNFASLLLALSRDAIPDLWLTEISFTRGEAAIELKGYAMQTLLVKDYLSKLESDGTFKNYSFNLDELDEKNVPSAFHITSKRANL